MPTTLEVTIPGHSTPDKNISRLFKRATFINCPPTTYVQNDPVLVAEITRLYENGQFLNPICPICRERIVVPTKNLEYQYNP